MRKPIIAGNWKMNKLVADAVSTVEALKPMVSDISTVDIVVCPTFIALYATGKALQGSNVMMGGQNCYHEENGAFTGELAPQMLSDAGCQWTILGHSERRHIFGEQDCLLNKKLHYALKCGLKVMFCIGELLEERESGQMEAVLQRQVLEGMKDLTEADWANVVIAYEPVWAIGTGVTASPEQAQDAHAFVRGLVEKQWGASVAQAVRIQYGGSVKADNAAELIAKPDVDGFLVGGAALKADSFAAIVQAGK